MGLTHDPVPRYHATMLDPLVSLLLTPIPARSLSALRQLRLALRFNRDRLSPTVRQLSEGQSFTHGFMANWLLLSPGTIARLETQPENCSLSTLYRAVRGLHRMGLAEVTAGMLLGIEALPEWVNPPQEIDDSTLKES